MLIKNVSTRWVKLEDFPDERPMAPGSVLDISKYSVAERAKSDDLQEQFTKGALICLGSASTSPKVKAMMQKTPFSKYEHKETTMNQGEVIVPANNMKPLVGTTRNRADSLAQTQTPPQRYNKEALQKYQIESQQSLEGVPMFAEKDFDHNPNKSFVQIQNEEDVLTVSIDEQTGVTYAEKTPGVIRTEHARDPSVFVDNSKYVDDKIEGAKAAKEELKQKLDKKIVQIVEAKCLAPKLDGRPCNRKVVQGYNTCFEHMTNIDKTKYVQSKEKK